MAYRSKTGILFRPTSSMERLDRKVSVLGTDAFRKIATLEHKLSDLNGFMETIKFHMLEMQQTLALKDAQAPPAAQILDLPPRPKPAAQIMDLPPSPKPVASTTKGRTAAPPSSRRTPKVRKESTERSHRMVLRSRSKRDT